MEIEMDGDLEHRIRERAYELWEAEGQPEGREDQHWQQAHADIIEAQDKAAVMKAKPAKAAAAKKPTAKPSATKADPAKPVAAKRTSPAKKRS